MHYTTLMVCVTKLQQNGLLFCNSLKTLLNMWIIYYLVISFNMNCEKSQFQKCESSPFEWLFTCVCSTKQLHGSSTSRVMSD